MIQIMSPEGKVAVFSAISPAIRCELFYNMPPLTQASVIDAMPLNEATKLVKACVLNTQQRMEIAQLLRKDRLHAVDMAQLASLEEVSRPSEPLGLGLGLETRSAGHPRRQSILTCLLWPGRCLIV